MPATDNSLKQIIIGIVIILTAGTILAATGWNFTQVVKIPETYMKKSDAQATMDKNRDDLLSFMSRNREDHIAIEQKLDRLLELLMAHRNTENTSYTYNDINEENR